jgi:protein O-GlcNAc transferase
MPTSAELFEMAVQHHRKGDLVQAERAYRQLLSHDPHHAEPHNNLGSIFLKQGRFAEAATFFRSALQIHPHYPNAHFNLGLACQDQGQLAEAAACYRQAVRLNPDHEEAYNVLGLALVAQKQLAEASDCFRQVIRINPKNIRAQYVLGRILFEQGHVLEASACYRQVLQINPEHAEAYNDLGISMVKQQKVTEGAECFRQALRINPRFANAAMNQGNILRNQGYFEEALACYRRAMELEPESIGPHCNLVYTLYFCPGQNAETLAEEHRRWTERHAKPLLRFAEPHANDQAPERRLRIGYISPDLRIHPIGRFMLPLLEAHDHTLFEIFCYSLLNLPDAWTTRCQRCADVWRDVYGWSDDAIASAIRRDGIDILVDLTMHMAGGRLPLFARKPAPVQVTYLAYPGTTGLDTIDYRLTDKYLDPPEQNHRFYSEESVYLDSYWCYQEVSADLPLTPSPCRKTGSVTFGCLNNYCKVTAPTLETWSRILQAVPGSQLLLCTQQGSHRNRVTDFLSQRDISSERVVFVDFMKTLEYFRTYEHFDIALDPFPYGGGTTTCDALWMGVPVVCLAGKMAVGRGGVSILSQLGLTELLAQDTEEYIRIAVTLAGDRERLAVVRTTLRARMKQSPLMDSPRFARIVEAAYRTMWRRWCAAV